MARQPFISHVVNGYSRYDLPESKAFSATPGILYPVRIDFINARDRVKISQGIDVRSNPLVVPTFNPYVVRLHRFWVPLQLYHPEMRTNSSSFDMRELSLNFIPTTSNTTADFPRRGFTNSLLYWLRSHQGLLRNTSYTDPECDPSLTSSASPETYCNCDSYLAYWDIVRNYYSYSQWGAFSVAYPASWRPTANRVPSYDAAGNYVSGSITAFKYASNATSFYQTYCNLAFLDAYFESQFYPSSVNSSNNTFNRSNLFNTIIFSDLQTTVGGVASSDGYPVTREYPSTASYKNGPTNQFSSQSSTSTISGLDIFLVSHPMAVVPSSPDRFSRVLPPTASDDSVSMSNVTTIPQLAVASRLQEYRDLLGAGGSRFSDWLETFFASKIDHVDRPKLLFSASQVVNSQVIMNQSGESSPTGTSGGALGQMGGSISFNTTLGRSQSYYFKEPGYLIDMLSIRPVYYWSGIRPDYLNWRGSDYFNPVYNDIGYQSIALYQMGWYPNSGTSPLLGVYREPCFNEFRSSYDEVLGQLSMTEEVPTLYNKWVQQRSMTFFGSSAAERYKLIAPLFTDMSSVNMPFVSDVEDNFFVNLAYSVAKKNLVNKTFATRLANR